MSFFNNRELSSVLPFHLHSEAVFHKETANNATKTRNTYNQKKGAINIVNFLYIYSLLNFIARRNNNCLLLAHTIK